MTHRSLHRIVSAIPLLLPGIVLLMLGSCDFRPKKEFFRDLNPNVTPPVATIDLNGGKDTVFTNYQPLYAVINAGDHECRWVEVVIDSVSKGYVTGSKNAFTINPGLYTDKDGIYSMRLNFGVSTGTGSVADGAGAENFIYSRDLCYICRMNAQYMPGATLTPESGGIRIDCPPNPKANVDRSVIVKGPGDGSNDHDTVAVVTEYESRTAWDDNYVGERTWYERHAFLGNRDHTSLYPYITILSGKEPELPVVSVTYDANGIPTIRWTKSRYAANVDKYRLYREDYSYYTLIDSIENPSDTVFHYANCKFPDDLHVVLTSVPKKVPHYLTRDREINYFGSGSYNNHTGLASFSFSDLQTPAGDDLYYNYDRTIYRYNRATQTVTETMVAPGSDYNAYHMFMVSPNNKYLISGTGTDNLKYMVYNTATRQSSFFPALTIGGYNTGSSALIADNGIGIIIAYGKLTVYDFPNNQKILRVDDWSIGNPVCISPVGTYFFAGTRNEFEFYRIDADTITRIWNHTQPPFNTSYCSFIPDDPTKLITYSAPNLATRNCSNFTVVHSIAINVDVICNIDFNNRRVLGLYSNSTANVYEWRIYDLDTGALLKSIPRGGSVYLTDTRLGDQFLYWTDGYKFRVF